MDVDLAAWLTSGAASEVLEIASAEPDPTSLAAAERLRRHCPPDRAAAALGLVALRRRAVPKLGERASTLFLTKDGLEQATRPAVAARRAARLASAGARQVVDLCTGVGLDALAFADAGLAVHGVESDPATALLAAANLGPGHRVDVGRAEDADLGGLASGDAVFCDPARRTSHGRSWRVEDLNPSWAFVEHLLGLSGVEVCVKLGPGLPTRLVPDAAEAEWVSDRGDVVEVALWAGPGSRPGRRAAVVDGAELVSEASGDVDAGPLGDWLHEPDGAVIRAGLTGQVARSLDAHRVHDQVAYLTGPRPAQSPFVTSFEVLETLPLKALRGWVRDRRIGVLEIKKRGLDIDPAVLRKQLRPAGPHSATAVLTPTDAGATAIIVRR